MDPSAKQPDEGEPAQRAVLTQFERDVLAQALTDYSEGISESDYPDEEPDSYERTEAAIESISRKLLGD